ncbi:hypothetical protein GGTG_12951 [Gaeumannomyces tritici R3-111a-1]|uniref:Uncharacterized protein n=1 Tax=Gaeumannomyces tritici (strain R3-111a-1) TaxID=644352 RepID=J3PHH1_GAET3|nr:hypothetical protein GGTG_12951 [Gaeumannomyces tritici R3-111a-1]EJT69332.1 hypothetical protein GGTG_12951 [Gaeumannomyces tritici R3-111a-1]
MGPRETSGDPSKTIQVLESSGAGALPPSVRRGRRVRPAFMRSPGIAASSPTLNCVLDRLLRINTDRQPGCHRAITPPADLGQLRNSNIGRSQSVGVSGSSVWAPHAAA